MNEVEKAIEELEKLKKYAFKLESPDSYFIKMNGMETELSLVLSAFSLAAVTDVAISALEKQIPMKPKNIRNILFRGTTKPNFSDGECPNCGGYVNTDDNRYVCGQSGCYQALDWSVDE